MKLFHGSNTEVIYPQIRPSERKLDFGIGFYLTTDLDQAKKWAKLTTRRRLNGSPVVSVFEWDEKQLELNVLKFSSPNQEWLRFVSNNRKGVIQDNMYDIVIGPIANDKTMPVISLYFAGLYSEEEAIKRLLPQKLSNQVVFKTEIALKLLKFQEIIRYER